MTQWKEVKQYLRNGYKIAIEVHEALHVYAQKTDYIKEVERNGTQGNWVYTDYDGRCVDMVIDDFNKVIYQAPHHMFSETGTVVL